MIVAGYAGRDARDAERILAAAREAHIDHIDFLLITHFLNDHVGGVAELADRIPILRFVDYGSPLGSDRMATNGFRVYEPIRGENIHLEPEPGDRLPLDGVAVEIVSAAGVLLSKPLPGAGQPNSGCVTLEDQQEDGT